MPWCGVSGRWSSARGRRTKVSSALTAPPTPHPSPSGELCAIRRAGASGLPRPRQCTAGASAHLPVPGAGLLLASAVSRMRGTSTAHPHPQPRRPHLAAGRHVCGLRNDDESYRHHAGRPGRPLPATPSSLPVDSPTQQARVRVRPGCASPGDAHLPRRRAAPVHLTCRQAAGPAVRSATGSRCLTSDQPP